VVYYFWYFQPLAYSNRKDSNFSVVFPVDAIPGIGVGIVAFVASSFLPTIASSCGWALLWPLLTWQAIAGGIASVIGTFLRSFLTLTSTEWPEDLKNYSEKSVWLLQSFIFSFSVIDKSYRQVLTPVNNSQLLLKLPIADKFRLVTFYS
jgi:hypothetical protein